MAGREGGARTKRRLCLAVNLDSTWVAGSIIDFLQPPVTELAYCWWRRGDGFDPLVKPGPRYGAGKRGPQQAAPRWEQGIAEQAAGCGEGCSYFRARSKPQR